jgi:hypothetical protein
MFDPSPSEFQAIEGDWIMASEALAQAQSGLDGVLADFRRTGNNERLKTALQTRLSAKARLQLLIQKIWADPS